MRITLTVDQLDILPFTRDEFLIRAREDTILPPFLGTTLRGAFGNALKSIVCSVAHGECHRCLLDDRCLYPTRFATTAQSDNEPENAEDGQFKDTQDSLRQLRNRATTYCQMTGVSTRQRRRPFDAAGDSLKTHRCSPEFGFGFKVSLLKALDLE